LVHPPAVLELEKMSIPRELATVRIGLELEAGLEHPQTEERCLPRWQVEMLRCLPRGLGLLLKTQEPIHRYQ
jgi:hypothetical protein